MKRYCKGLYIYRFLNLALSFAFLLFCFSLDQEEFNPTFLIYGLVFYFILLLFFIIYFVILYKVSGYEITNEGIRIQRGVFFKKKSYLSYDKMNAINKKQGLIQKIFNVQGLFIDSGSTNADANAEIAIYSNPKIIAEIIATIKVRKYEVKEELNQQDEASIETVYQYTIKDKIGYILMGGVGALLCSALFLSVSVAILIFIEKSMDFFIGSLWFLLAFFIFAEIAMIIFIFFQYFNFKITKDKNELYISYGLFIKVENKLPLKKVRALRIEQGIIKRLFGYASLNVDVVGYGGTNLSEGGDNTLGILIPLCKAKNVSSYIDKTLPQYSPVETNHKSKGFFSRISYYLLWYLIISIFLIGIGFMFFMFKETKFLATPTIIVSIMLICLLICITLVNAAFANKNAGFEIVDSKLTIQNGGLIKKTIVVFRKDVIAVEDVTTYFRRKKQMYSYRIHIHSNRGKSQITVNILDETVRKELLDFINL